AIAGRPPRQTGRGWAVGSRGEVLLRFEPDDPGRLGGPAHRLRHRAAVAGL
ncbi:MAG: hypothetical protein AVDCRST_MAG19-4044, partial [uncultured Thermomicrobiales bacterium]